ncbi:Uncharacterized conserved protein, contains LRR repeats [Plasmopara halstedii]|uniref:RNA polymerase II-associated protein 3 n=1 Tax=Plasmopara halstedii TaxID=4781 RepID=A0A0P1AW29_PLAHL|nr:Uncharacterized conserved protein, contains LRR repeats [Plasmopara halstedii]CEG45719.1 Uncharacterized conserved protein, contains LRR repeats [Plasmopara halstedii]|eukprot:XP_024582088.1 Uncharacterized conserved protein, contains LRR repeats [Plasmopara halstedii]
MKESSVPSVVEMQHQIRSNASRLQDYYSDLYAWEKRIGQEELARKKTSKTTSSSATALPPRSVNIISGNNRCKDVAADHMKAMDAHTHDKGYKRWEKFDVDAALKKADKEDNPQLCNESPIATQNLSCQVAATKKTPASLTASKTREELEREDGNLHYKQGDFVAAIKSYTRCLGYNPQNVVVLSNRAMAYLKNREYTNAEDDCTLALETDLTHVKSYMRRGTARNSLGKHRLALLDFQQAATLDPKSRQIQTQLQSTRELIRMAIKRSPKRTEFTIKVVNEKSGIEDKKDINSSVQERTEKSSLPSSQSPSPAISASSGSRSDDADKHLIFFPKFPKKAPATSYEFARVWKTLALRGDEEQKCRLLHLRADYLRIIDPPALSAVFKSGMESDVLCEIFHTLRHAILIQITNEAVSKESVMFALALASELTKVPRFNMIIMLLSSREKVDILWVINRLAVLIKNNYESRAQEVADLFQLYELS